MKIAVNENDSIIKKKRDIHLIKYEKGKHIHSARTQVREISPMIK